MLCRPRPFPGPVWASSLIGSDQIQSRVGWGSNLANASHADDTPPDQPKEPASPLL